MSPTHETAAIVTPMTPRKTCEECGKLILRKRLLVRDWEQIRHCSAACRRLNRDRVRAQAARRFLSPRVA